MRRILAVLAMAIFGLAVYLTLGALKSRAGSAAQGPNPTGSRVDVAGTMFLVQQGVLYKLHNGAFTRLGSAPAGQWMQPALSPDRSHLVAVDHHDQFSDLYSLDLGGKVIRQLTDNHGGGAGALQHWAFYPRYSPDGQTLYYSYDGPKFAGNFRVDLAIWSMAAGAQQRSAKRASTPNDYTGGDTYPIPLAGGALLYAKYDIGAGGPASEIWYQARALSPGKALTLAEEDCGQPALSPDASRVAMVCTGGKQVGRIEVADLGPGGELGPRQVLVDGVLGASPAFSPDGRTIAYFAPAGAQRHFQLWTVTVPAPGPTPQAGPAKQLTTDLDFDATSAPAWTT